MSADIPAGSLVAGVPGTVRRRLTEELIHLRPNAATDLGLARRHAAAMTEQR